MGLLKKLLKIELKARLFIKKIIMSGNIFLNLFLEGLYLINFKYDN